VVNSKLIRIELNCDEFAPLPWKVYEVGSGSDGVLPASVLLKKSFNSLKGELDWKWRQLRQGWQNMSWAKQALTN
jgi:hypothetical protein